MKTYISVTPFLSLFRSVISLFPSLLSHFLLLYYNVTVKIKRILAINDPKALIYRETNKLKKSVQYTWLLLTLNIFCKKNKNYKLALAIRAEKWEYIFMGKQTVFKKR